MFYKVQIVRRESIWVKLNWQEFTTVYFSSIVQDGMYGTFQGPLSNEQMLFEGFKCKKLLTLYQAL